MTVIRNRSRQHTLTGYQVGSYNLTIMILANHILSFRI